MPLYVGIAITGVGVEHIVRTGGATPLHAEEAVLLCGAVALFVLALTLVGIASDRLLAPARRRLTLAATTVAAAMAALVPLAHSVPPGVVVTSLAGLTAAHGAVLKHWRTR